MLVLITYDVNTSDAAGRGRLRRIAIKTSSVCLLIVMVNVS